jgi:DNA-binding protein H-NS
MTANMRQFVSDSYNEREVFFMANELREYEIELRKEGETKARKKIARKMKSLGIFSNEFIAELVELDIKTIERIKANDEQSETRTS